MRYNSVQSQISALLIKPSIQHLSKMVIDMKPIFEKQVINAFM